MKKIHALMFKVLKCSYIFEPTDRFTDEHIQTDLLFQRHIVVSHLKNKVYCNDVKAII